MATITVRNLPEAETRHILETTALPPEQVKLGTLLMSIAREAGGLTDKEVALFNNLRDKTPARAVEFE